MIGKTGSQLVEALTRLSNAYSDPKFIGDVNSAVRNVSKAGDRIAVLSQEVTKLSEVARGQIDGIGDAIRNTDQAAQDASKLIRNVDSIIVENRTDVDKTIKGAANLTHNLNTLVEENRENIVNTLNSIEQTSDQIRLLALNFGVTVDKINQGISEIDIKQFANDLESLMSNAALTAKNLQNLSKSLSDPEVIITIQQTLDSARVTFDNAQKITSDVEELTGDPVFRNNIRKLIDGLSDLVSETESLEQQVYATQIIESVTNAMEYKLLSKKKLQEFSPIIYPLDNSAEDNVKT